MREALGPERLFEADLEAFGGAELLGVQAQIGRTLRADDDRADAAKVAVLTDGLWHQQYGGSSDALGKTMILNGMPHTIVGVLPRSFDMQMVAGGEVWMTSENCRRTCGLVVDLQHRQKRFLRNLDRAHLLHALLALFLLLEELALS